MELFEQEGDNKKIPYILLDSTGDLRIIGRSFPEDASRIYEPVLRWMELYKKAPSFQTVLRLDMESFNIGTSKYILYMIYHLQEIDRKGGQVSIEWFYEEGDEDMIEVGEDYEIMAGIPFYFKRRSPQAQLAQKATLSSS